MLLASLFSRCWRVKGSTMTGVLGLAELFEGRHFDREVIVLCVRWYLCFKLSFRDLVEMMAERGLSMVHTTIMRWVHHYAPEFAVFQQAEDFFAARASTWETLASEAENLFATQPGVQPTDTREVWAARRGLGHGRRPLGALARGRLAGGRPKQFAILPRCTERLFPGPGGIAGQRRGAIEAGRARRRA